MSVEQLAPPTSQHNLEQARLAAFIAERVDRHRDIFRQLGKTGLNVGSVFVRPAESNEGERVIATTEDYDDFLSRAENHNLIAGRAELLQNYDHFRSEVQRVTAEVASTGRPKDHPNHLGYGDSADAIVIDVDNKPYVVRIMLNAPDKARTVDGYVSGTLLAKGHPRFEQLAAISYEDGVTVGEMVPGKAMGDLSPEEYATITDAQLDTFVDDLIFAHQKGILLDSKPDNFHYDSKLGICMLDLDSANSHQTLPTLGKVVGEMAGMIENVGFYSRNKDEIDYSREAIEIGARLEVLRRYRHSVIRKLDTPERETALEMIDDVIAYAQDRFLDYTDPEGARKDVNEQAEITPSDIVW